MAGPCIDRRAAHFATLRVTGTGSSICLSLGWSSREGPIWDWTGYPSRRPSRPQPSLCCSLLLFTLVSRYSFRNTTGIADKWTRRADNHWSQAGRVVWPQMPLHLAFTSISSSSPTSGCSFIKSRSAPYSFTSSRSQESSNSSGSDTLGSGIHPIMLWMNLKKTGVRGHKNIRRRENAEIKIFLVSK